MSRTTGWWKAAVTAVALAAASPPALAQSSEQARAAAQDLFEQAQALKAARKLEAACAKFAASQKLDPAPGTQLNLADCYEQTGRTASAWINYVEVAAASRKGGSSERAKIAEARAQTLKPKLSRMLIEVKGPTEGLTVERSKEPVLKDMWGTAVPVDPGEYEISAHAPGKQPWTKKVTVAPTATTVTVTVPSLAAAEEASAATRAAEDDSTAAPVHLGLGITCSALGLAGIAVGAAYTVVAGDKLDKAEPYCAGDDQSACWSELGVTFREQAQTAQKIYVTGYVLGGAFLVAGIVLLATTPSSNESPASEGSPQALLVPEIGPAELGLTLLGRW